MASRPINSIRVTTLDKRLQIDRDAGVEDARRPSDGLSSSSVHAFMLWKVDDRRTMARFVFYKSFRLARKGAESRCSDQFRTAVKRGVLSNYAFRRVDRR